MSGIPRNILVQIKSYDDICKTYGLPFYSGKPLVPGGWVPNMQRYCGKFFRVKELFDDYRNIYKLYNSCYVWHIDSFNLIESKKGNVFTL